MYVSASLQHTRLSAAAVISLFPPLFHDTPPLCAVSCKALPGHSGDVDSLHISHADIFISQVRAAYGSPPHCQLTVEDVFRNATILHTADMAQPSQYSTYYIY